MIWFSPLLVLSLFLGCDASETEQSVCDKMCSNLVNECEYDAFPDFASCEQGCEYNAEQGADITSQQLCIESAECDTFAILECELAFGDPSLEDSDVP